jgi:uncharacterized cupredoxin-like copper-binding protein
MRLRVPLVALCAAALFTGLPAAAHGPEKHEPKAVATAPGGHGEALGEPGDPKAKARTIAVSMNDEMRFTPNRFIVAKGETIRFEVKNVGKLKHEMVLGTLQELKDHAELMQKFPEMEHDDPNAVGVEPGKTGVLLWKFTKAGEFDFGCLVPGHFEANMKGKITVK